MIRFAEPHKTKKLAQRRSRGAEIHVNDHEEGETKTGVRMDQGPQADARHAQQVRGQAFGEEQSPARHCQYGKKQEHHHQIKKFLERVEFALVAVRVRMWLSDEYAPQIVAGLPDQPRFDIAGHNLVVAAIPEDEISEQEQPVKQSQQYSRRIVNKDISPEAKRRRARLGNFVDRKSTRLNSS